MDWSEETWVKLYTRETTTMAMMPWETRAVLHELMKRVGFDGVVPLGRHGLRGLASLLRMPENVVQDAVADLAGEGVLAVADGETSLLLVNFYDAQKARTSDKERKRRSRDSKAAEAKATAGVVTASHSPSHLVTNRIEETREEETRSPQSPQGGTGDPDAGLWSRKFDSSRRGEILQVLWDAYGKGHPTPKFARDEVKLAEKLHGYLSGESPPRRAALCAGLVAWTGRDFQPKDKVSLLLTGAWSEASEPERTAGKGSGYAEPAPHSEHGKGEVLL